jgi:hypothetical protein
VGVEKLGQFVSEELKETFKEGKELAHDIKENIKNMILGSRENQS